MKKFLLGLLGVFVFLLLLCAGAFAWAHIEFHPLPKDAVADRILIEKSAHRLTLYHGAVALKSYPVALGPHAGDGTKQQEGDCRTPEGNYTIDNRNAESACHLGLHLSYPEPRDIAAAQKNGVPPGEDIMIHGLVNGTGWLGKFHRFTDWTLGCVAVSDGEMDEIWRAVPMGTKVEIRP